MASHIGVTVREAGWILGKSEPQVRRLLASGTLEYAVIPTRVTSTSVELLLPEDALRELRRAALTAIVEGRLRAPIPESRYAKPASIRIAADLLSRRTEA